MQNFKTARERFLPQENPINYPIMQSFGILRLIESLSWHTLCPIILLVIHNGGVMMGIEGESMTNSLDDFIKEIQNQINEETMEAYGQVVFERWLRPRYVGVMENPDGYGHVAGSCGDRMEIFLRFEDDHVKEATFRTDGCGSSLVCGSFAAELALGKKPDELAEISGETILEALGGLPEEDRHCALLAAETLQEALDNYMKKQRRKK